MTVKIPDSDRVYVSGPGIEAALADVYQAALAGLQASNQRKPGGPQKLAYIVARCQRLEADWRRASTGEGGLDA